MWLAEGHLARKQQNDYKTSIWTPELITVISDTGAWESFFFFFAVEKATGLWQGIFNWQMFVYTGFSESRS